MQKLKTGIRFMQMTTINLNKLQDEINCCGGTHIKLKAKLLFNYKKKISLDIVPFL